MQKKEYQNLVQKFTPNSPLKKDLTMAFLFGGGICCFAQILRTVFENINLQEKEVKIAVSSTIIIITAILTAIGVFDKIAKVAGAGTVVPITGFANSVVSPALEFSIDESDIIGHSQKDRYRLRASKAI